MDQKPVVSRLLERQQRRKLWSVAWKRVKASPNYQAQRRFNTVVDSLSVLDVAALTQIHTYQSRAFDYHLQEQSISTTSMGWPVAWLLGRVHQKHVYHRQLIPDPETLRRDLLNFCNRLRWRHWFAHQKFKQPFQRPKPREAGAFVNKVAPELDTWILGFPATIARTFAVTRQARRRTDLVIPFFARLALRLLKKTRQSHHSQR